MMAIGDAPFTCECCFSNERIGVKEGWTHRVPIDCRSERWYKSIVERYFDMMGNPEKLMEAYGEIMEERADIELHGYRT